MVRPAKAERGSSVALYRQISRSNPNCSQCSMIEAVRSSRFVHSCSRPSIFSRNVSVCSSLPAIFLISSFSNPHDVDIVSQRSITEE